MKPRKWTVYALLDSSGTPEYVGRTISLKRRLKEHGTRLGRKPSYWVLEQGECEECFDLAEQRWIETLNRSGLILQNATEGGRRGRWISEKSRRQLSEAVTGRPVTWGDKISAAQRGKKKNWSKEGRERVMAAAKLARRSFWEPMTTEERSAFAKSRSAAFWERLSPEERSRMASERNREAWGRRTHDERSAIGKKIAAARKASGREPKNGKYERTTAQREAVGRGVKEFWKKINPEERAKFLARRGASISEAKKAKRQKLAQLSSPRR